MFRQQWLLAVVLLATGASASSPVQDCPTSATQELFIADTSNLCAFWRCLAGAVEIRACPAGIRLPSYYTSGYDQPCTIRTETCLRCNCSLDVPPPPPTDDQIDFCSILSPCEEGCTCMNTMYDFQCLCPIQAELPPVITPPPPSGMCQSNPCRNGGTCNEVWEDFFCQCVPPWTGKTCDIDFCHPNPCHNGGTCFSTNVTFWCVCPPCFAEPCCATGSQSCQCNDSCTLPTAPTCYDYKGELGEELHKCGCPKCKLGPYCNTSSNACACNNDCSALSDCVDVTDANGFPNHKCVCKPCWTGPGCTQRVQSCACNNDCLQGSTCVDQADLSGRLLHRCVCPPCRSGPTCQDYDYSTCACNPCNSTLYKVCEDADFGSGLPRICRNTITGSVYTIVFQENNVEQDTLFLPLELYVSSSDDDGQDRFVTVSAPLGGCGGFTSINQIVKPRTVGRFTVPLCMRCDGTGFCNKAIRVEETRKLTITLYSLNRMQFSADGALHLPDDKAGNDFFAIAYKPNIATQIAVVALEDNTNVSIRFSHDASQLGADADGIRRIKMNKNQVFQIQGLRTSGAIIGTDLTASYVHADKPINVFSGSIRDYAPRSDPLFNNDAKSRDHLVEQLPPAQSWTNQFALVPIANRAVGDIVRVIAPSVVPDVIKVYSSATPGSATAFSFATPLPENAPFVEFHARSDAVFYIESQQPIMVAQLTLSKDGSDGTAYLNGDEFVHDPSLILIHGIDQYSNNYAMSTPMFSGGLTSSQGLRPYNTTQLMLVADLSVRDGILLNEASVNTYSFVRPWTRVPAPGKTLYASAISLRHGTTIIRHPDANARFGCWVYGYDDRESYGFPCGLSLAKRNSL